MQVCHTLVLVKGNLVKEEVRNVFTKSKSGFRSVSVAMDMALTKLTIYFAQLCIFVFELLEFVLEDLERVDDLGLGYGDFSRWVVHTELNRYILPDMSHLDLLT